MSRVGRIIVTSGLLVYGGIALLATVITLVNRTGTFALAPLLVVSLPWSWMFLEAFETLLNIRARDLPGGDAWPIGMCLTGVAINCFLFWLLVKWSFKLVEGGSRDRNGSK
jgi:hypothetical protein